MAGPFYFDGAHRIERRFGVNFLDGIELEMFDVVLVKRSTSQPWEIGEVDYFDESDPTVFFRARGAEDAIEVEPSWRIHRAHPGIVLDPEEAIELPVVQAVARYAIDYRAGRVVVSDERGTYEEASNMEPLPEGHPVSKATLFVDRVGDGWIHVQRTSHVERDMVPMQSRAMLRFEDEVVECVAFEDLREMSEIWKRARASDAEEARLVEEESAARLGNLYVVEFSTGTVKVGRSRTPDQRIENHAGEARKFGVWITRRWVSTAHRSHFASERALIRACAAKGSLITGREYFRIDFDEAVRLAERAIERTPPPRERSAGSLKALFPSMQDRDRERVEQRAARRLHVLKVVG